MNRINHAPLTELIIELWTNHPELRLSVRELSSQLRCSPHTLRQAVYKLRREGRLMLSTEKMYFLSSRERARRPEEL